MKLSFYETKNSSDPVSMPFISSENTMLSLICISQALAVIQDRKKWQKIKEEEPKKNL